LLISRFDCIYLSLCSFLVFVPRGSIKLYIYKYRICPALVVIATSRSAILSSDLNFGKIWNMSVETKLDTLIASMSPELMDEDYVFCTFPNTFYGQLKDLQPCAAVQEDEGLTLIFSKIKADENNLKYETIFKRISLKVHSSLEAVGLTAAFSKALSETGISANVIAGFYHDHIFVQAEEAEKAVQVLKELSASMK